MFMKSRLVFYVPVYVSLQFVKLVK